MSALAWSPGHLHIAGASSPDPQRHRPLVDNVKSMHILGISAFYHDSAACLLRDGEIVAAAQEERFTRKKGDAAFPAHGRRLLPAARPGSRSRTSPTSASTTSRCSSSSASSRPTSASRRAGSGRSSWPGRSGSRRSSSPTGSSATTLGLRGRDPLRRAPRVARGERVLPVAVRGGRHPDDGRRRRMGHGVVRRRAAATTSRSSTSCTGPTRSACSTRRSPTTPASRSTRASTRSWASRRTASRSTST